MDSKDNLPLHLFAFNPLFIFIKLYIYNWYPTLHAITPLGKTFIIKKGITYYYRGTGLVMKKKSKDWKVIFPKKENNIHVNDAVITLTLCKE